MRHSPSYVRKARHLITLFALAAICACKKSPAPTYIEPMTGMKFVLLQRGEFLMGSPDTEPGHQANEQLHSVRIAKPFYIGAYEVTQREWSAVMGSNPSHFRSFGPGHMAACHFPLQNPAGAEADTPAMTSTGREPGY